jgi:predicted dehydrogenase
VPAATESVVRLGVVGGGLIAQVAHLPALRSLDALFDVRALAEPRARVRGGLALRYGIPQTYERHEALIERSELDALLVCSPNGTHARVVDDALDAGLHVLVEKPLCLDPADARRIAARAEADARIVQVGYMKRFDPAYEALPDAGGLILASTATVDPGIGRQYAPPGFLTEPGNPSDGNAQVAAALDDDDPRHVAPYSGAFLGALIHDVNLVLGATDGEWRVTDGASADDGSLAYGAWADAGGARWTALWLLSPAVGAFREDVRLYGRDGVAALRFPSPYAGVPAELRVNGIARRVEPANPYVRQLEHFHACVTRGDRCRTPAAQGARDVAVLADLYRKAIA